MFKGPVDVHFFVHQESEGVRRSHSWTSSLISWKRGTGLGHLGHFMFIWARFVFIWMSVKALHSVCADLCGQLCLHCVCVCSLQMGKKSAAFIGLGWKESLGTLRQLNLAFFKYFYSLLASHMMFLRLHYLLLFPDCILHKERHRHHDAAQQKRKQE